MTTDNTTPLAPCVFCSAPGAYLTSNGHHNHFVECEACGANGPVCATEAKAAGAWNRRTPAPSVAAGAAQPAPQAMSEIDIADDRDLRFVQRVLESQAPESDRLVARNMIVALRTRVRGARASSTGEKP